MYRKYIIILFFLFSFSNLFSQEAYEINTDFLGSIGIQPMFFSSEVHYSSNMVFYKFKNVYYSINLETNEIKEFGNKEISRIFYSTLEYLIVGQREIINPRYERDIYRGEMRVYYYYPKEERYKRIEGLTFDLSTGGNNYIFIAPDIKVDKYILSYFPHNDSQMTRSSLFNVSDQSSEIIIDEGNICDLSDDKIHALVYDYRSHDVIVYNMIENRSFSSLKREIDGYSIGPPIFITNNLFITRKKGNEYVVYNLDYEPICSFTYKKPYDWGLYFASSFTRAKNGSIGILSKSDGERRLEYIVVKTSGEYEALDSLGLLFHPTIGTANDSRVRIREWPLLEAKHLDYLTKGDKLEILDRSGIKVKIGEMEDYWYKIRRLSDGIEGWSYGKFIDIEGE